MGSVLYYLSSRSADIAESFLWSESEGIWYVLTGQAPTIEPVHAELRVARDLEGRPLRTEVLMRWQPFVAFDGLKKAAAAATLLLQRKSRLRTRRLAVFNFVTAICAENGWEQPKGLRSLVKRFDAEHPELSYNGNPGNFIRAYDQVREKLVGAFATLEDTLESED